uniref:Uncharacterized protein n=1 Tax=Vespula pensylvanica TaxID=30213 RepID=A0A834P6B5_VESPE|nr:hypothetical protein H0235_005734 [Vespula pensylvanica]
MIRILSSFREDTMTIAGIGQWVPDVYSHDMSPADPHDQNKEIAAVSGGRDEENDRKIHSRRLTRRGAQH